jgi:hypothetical protein
MNVLIDKLPTKIKVNDNIYNINSDFRTIINIILAFEDKELTNNEQVYIMLKNLYKEEVRQEDTYEAMKKALKFIDGGIEPELENDIKPKRIYSFKKDGNYIFSGINQTHHINLSENENMHWWVFLSFFMDMSTDCTFGELIYYRKRKNENKLTKEEKEQYKKIKKLVDLDEKDKMSSQVRKEFLDKFRELNKK